MAADGAEVDHPRESVGQKKNVDLSYNAIMHREWKSYNNITMASQRFQDYSILCGTICKMCARAHLRNVRAIVRNINGQFAA